MLHIAAPPRLLAALSLAGATLAAVPAAARDAQTTRVSVSSAEEQANAASEGSGPWGAISASGRFVAFSSEASNLTGDDGDAKSDVFVRDRGKGTTTRVSRGSAAAFGPSISGDGRFVSYRADGLRLRDRWTGRTRSVRLARRGVPADRIILVDQELASDGRALGFVTARRDRFGESVDYAIYRYDVRSRRTRRVTPFVFDIGEISVSASGRFVAFTSAGFTRRDDGRTRRRGVLVRDLGDGSTRRVDRSTGGRPGNRFAFDPAISGDGRHVAFTSRATNLASGASSRRYRVYVRDLRRGRTRRVSPKGDHDAGSPALSHDGRRVAFRVSPDDAISDIGGPFGEVYVRDRRAGKTALVSVTRSGAPSARSGFPVLSRSGRVVAFASASGDLVTDDTNAVTDIFARGPLYFG